ncbi:hypothetical protein CR513_02583, partial [Mucuna pruriens]
MTGFEKKRGETIAILVHPSSQSKIKLSKSEATSSVDLAPMPKRENSSNTTNNRYGGRNRVFTPIHMTYITLFPKLLQKNLIAVRPLKPLENLYPRSNDPNTKCDYHAGAIGHSTERCWSFKHKVQDLINVGWFGFEENEPNVNTNSLPVHGGQSINVLSHEIQSSSRIETSPVELGEVAMLERVESPPQEPLVPARPAYKDDHVVPWQYDSYIEDLPAESIDNNSAKEVTNIAEVGGMTRSGRMYSPETLKKKCSTPEKTIEAPKRKEVEEFLKLIWYSEYELLEQMNKTPTQEEVLKEGRKHNQPLHISVKCGEYMIARVLIDNGSSLNVLPKTTLDKLCSIDSQLRTTSVVMNICPAYSYLLGRPWIHTTGVILSSLHQKVKFIANHQLISVMGEKELMISTTTPKEYIEGEEEALETSFQSLEIANSENISSTPATEKMEIRVMIKEGYQPGKGLGPHLNGIPTPITVQENKGRAGLGYQGGNQGKHIDSFPNQSSLNQYFVSGGVTMIGDEPRSWREELHKIKEGLANWTAKELFDEDLFIITNNELSLNGNAIPMDEDPSQTDESIKDDEAEIKALEKPKFQPWAEELKSINMGDEKEKKEVKVGKQMPPDLKIELMELLKEYADIFAWSYRDMPGLDREIMEHKLPLLPNATPVRQ